MFRIVLFVLALVAISPSGFSSDVPSGATRVTPPEPWEARVADLTETLSSWPSADTAMISDVARAVARNAHLVGVDADLVLAVIRVENPWLKPDTISYAGAVGLLQVMPRYWDDEFKHCGSDLTDVETNVCKGVEVLRHYIVTNDTLEDALLAYNGCKSAHCESYYDYVTRQLD